MPFADLSSSPPEPGVGSSLLLQLDLRNDAGVSADPADLTLVIKRPDGAETSVPKAAMTSPSVGRWVYGTTADQAGTWAFEFRANAPTIVSGDSLTVVASPEQGQRATGQGPCQPWCSPTEMRDGWTPPAGVSETALERAALAASEACFELGGRRWPGVCWDSVLPSVVSCGDLGFAVWPLTGGGLGVGPAPRPAGFGWDPLAVPLLDLGAEPIVTVEAVRENGVVLDPATYRIVEGRYLARIDGGGWASPNLVSAATPYLAVDFTFGAAPPALGVEAAIALARQLALSGVPDSACTLNRRVRSVIREGLQVDLAVPGLVDSLRDGYTGVAEVDLFIASVNPNGLRRAARVTVPGRQAPTHIG